MLCQKFVGRAGEYCATIIFRARVARGVRNQRVVTRDDSRNKSGVTWRIGNEAAEGEREAYALFTRGVQSVCILK